MIKLNASSSIECLLWILDVKKYREKWRKLIIFKIRDSKEKIDSDECAKVKQHAEVSEMNEEETSAATFIEGMMIA